MISNSVCVLHSYRSDDFIFVVFGRCFHVVSLFSSFESVRACDVMCRAKRHTHHYRKHWKRRVRANIKFTSRTSTHLLWKWSLYVLCVVRSLSSFSDVSHYFASLGTFSVCFQNVKTNNCIMFMQPLVRCVQNIHKDVNDKITPTHKQTHKHTHWVLNGDSKSNVEHFAFGLLVV